MNKRCGLPLALPLLAKKLCPGLSFILQTRAILGAWKTGKTRHILPVHRRDGRRHMPSGAGQSPQIEKNRKADMAVMVMSAFLMAASRQRKDNRSPAGLPRLQRRRAAGGTRKESFSGPLERHAAAPAGAHPCMSRFRKRWTGRAIGSHRIPTSGLTRHDEEEEGSVARRRLRVSATGAMAPCLTVLF